MLYSHTFRLIQVREQAKWLYCSQVTQRTIERWLKQLREADRIEFIGSSKIGGYYQKQ
ncbi:hypothetical protein [Pelodictyon phaeoclathratiforme]|uniref:hypothetical protein n=1 Tax=Pelodictyon phaeoclathratiforme TaxID=34090 RepID=UPI0002FB706D|nr:hypothetical protein [Pelodictyon phaeoclathratiforme]